MSATVIIPTTGSPQLKDAIASVLKQTYPTKCYVVADGVQAHSRVRIITDNFLKREHIDANLFKQNSDGIRINLDKLDENIIIKLIY